jgi:carbamoyltransferase
MLICGIKITHDAGVAVIDDGKLLFSIEVEKLDNAERYSSLEDLGRVGEILQSQGLSLNDMDQFVIDGWFPSDGSEFSGVIAPAVLPVLDHGRAKRITVAPYQDRGSSGEPLARRVFSDHDFAAEGVGYASYHHVSNHLMGAYCSSPFAARGEDALVLVWDGAMAPRLYHVAAASRLVTPVSTLLPITGNAFGDFSAQFEPFIRNTDGLGPEAVLRTHLAVAGKAMAYAALGADERDTYPLFDDILAGFPDISPENAKAVGRKVAANRDELFPGLTNADLIASYQGYLGQLLLDRLAAQLKRRIPGQTLSARLTNGTAYQPNLVLAGGCALNIKWNSLLRASGLFQEIWIPPFPNDSGAAIGTACCEMFRQHGRTALEWSVFSGPPIEVGDVPAGWRARPCDEAGVARILHGEGEPVVVLSGRAEIGPRALGSRSILAPATSAAMKDRLNGVKSRASYRPVAPMCLETRAAEVFTPGNRDPYMLFEHRTTPSWTERLPAILHLDGTARLQTIDPKAGTAAGRILAEYEQLSGLPVLCNTSANFNGSGFFPDVASAATWGGVQYIWSDGTLWENEGNPLRGVQ